jgi:hypothetical protein
MNQERESWNAFVKACEDVDLPRPILRPSNLTGAWEIEIPGHNKFFAKEVKLTVCKAMHYVCGWKKGYKSETGLCCKCARELDMIGGATVVPAEINSEAYKKMVDWVQHPGKVEFSPFEEGDSRVKPIYVTIGDQTFDEIWRAGVVNPIVYPEKP